MAILKIHDTLGKVIFQTKRGLNVSRWCDRLIELPKWFSNAVMKDTDMSCVDMSCTVFDEGVFDDVNFLRARLPSVNWISSEFDAVNFIRATLTANEFYRGKITGADFALADLRGSTFTDVEIYDSYFNLADLRGAQFIMLDRLIEPFITTCNFEHAKLDGCTVNDKPIQEWINKYNQD